MMSGPTPKYGQVDAARQGVQLSTVPDRWQVLTDEIKQRYRTKKKKKEGRKCTLSILS